MAESGIDLSFDEPKARMSVPTKSSERYRVIGGSKRPQPSGSLSSSGLSQSVRQPRLRSNQRLQLMKMQAAEADAKGRASGASFPSQNTVSASVTTNGFSFPSFQTQHSTPLSSSQPTVSLISGELGQVPFLQLNDDEDVLLQDINGVLEDDASSYASSYNTTPSVANSCIVEFPGEMHDVQMEDDNQTSSSCPLIPLRAAMAIQPYRGGRKKEPPPVFNSEESRVQWLREREKKDQHNNIEKKRRSKINDFIQELATLLPENYDIDLQNKKGNILEASVDYIRKLQNEEKRMSQMRQQQEELERQNRRLQLQIELLRMGAVPQSAPSSTIVSQPTQPSATMVQAPPPQPPAQADFLNQQQLPTDFDFLHHGNLDLLTTDFDLSALDPAFADLNVTADPPIPVMVDDFMEVMM